MAEKVIVKSTNDFNGAQFENAATEATLKRLVDLMEKQKPGSGKAIKDAAKKSKDQGIDPKIVKEANDSFSQVGNANKKAVSDLNNSAKDTNSAFSKINNSTKIAGANLEKSSKESSGIFGKIGGAAGKAASGIGGLAVDLVKFAASGPLALLGTAFSLATSSILDSMDALRTTGSVGASFNGSLLELNKSAAASGMNLQEYSAFIKENSQVMAALGGTATEGAKRMGILSKELRSSEVGEQMMALGYTSKDLNTGLADYIQNEALRGRLQGKSDADLRKGAGEYVKQMSELSRLTGESAEALQKKMNDELRDARVQALMAGMSDDQQKDFQSRLAYLNSISPELGNAFKDLASGVADNDTANEMRRLNPQLAAMAEGIQRGVIPSQNELDQQLKKTNAANQSFMKSLGEGRGAVVASNEGMRGMAKIGADLNRVQAQNLAASKEEGTQSGQFTKAVMNAGNILNTFWSDIKSAFLESKVFKNVTDGVNWLTEKLMGFKDPLSSFIKSFDPDKALGGILPKMTDGFMGFINKMTPTLGNIGSSVLDTVKGMMPSLEKTFNNVLGSVSKLGTTMIDSVTGLNFGKIGDTIKRLVSSISDSVTGMLPALQNMFDKFFGTIGRIWTKIVDTVSGSSGNIEGIFKKIIDIAGKLGTTIMNVFSNLYPTFEKIWDVGLKLGSSIVSIVSSIMPQVEKAFNSIVGIIVPVISSIGSFFNSAFSGLNIDGMTSSIKKNFVGILQVFQDVIDNFFGPIFQTINQNLVKIGPKIGPIFSDLVEIISDVAGIIGNIVGAVASVLIPILRPVGQFLIDSFTPLVDLFGSMVSIVKGVVKLLKGDFGGFAEAMGEGIGGLFNYITSVIGNIVRLLGNIITPFKEAFDDIADMIETFPLYIKKAVSSILPDWVSSKLGLETSDDIDKKLAARKKQMDEAKVAKASDKKDEPKKEGTLTASNEEMKRGMAKIGADLLAKEVKEGSDPSKLSPTQKDQAVGISTDLNETLKATVRALDPTGKMSNDELLKALKDKTVAGAMSTDQFAQMAPMIAQLNQFVKTPTSSTPQPPRDYNEVRWKAEEEASKKGVGSNKLIDEAGDRAVAAAKAEDEAKEAAANQVATLNTVSDGIGKLSGIMMAILDLQLQQVEAQKDLVNAAKGRYNVTS